MKKTNGTQTVWLDNSRIIAIFAVVILHTACEVTNHNGLESSQWFFGAMYDALCRWCVPVFLMISGALLLDPGKKESLADFYKKRMSRILIPILFWSVFFVIWACWMGQIKWKAPAIDYHLEMWRQGEPYYHMWFMYMIIFLYVFTPFFRTIVANTDKKDLVFFVCAAFLLAGINAAYQSMHDGRSKVFSNWFLMYVPYFFAGYLIRQHKAKPSRLLLSLGTAILIIFTFMFYYVGSQRYGVARGEYFYDYLSITVIPTSICLMYLFKSYNKPIVNAEFTKRVAGLILGVYLVHPLALEFVVLERFGFHASNAAYAIPLGATAAFLLSLAGAWVIGKIPYVKRLI